MNASAGSGYRLEPVLHTVGSLTASQLGLLARVLTDALDDDPAYRFLFPEAAQRQRGLYDFFASNLHMHLPFRCTHVLTAQDGELIGGVTVRPPGGLRVSPRVLVLRGLVPFALRQGRGPLLRLFWLKEAYEALEARSSRGEPHFHVHMMAIAPALQGRGLGARLLATALRRSADAGSLRHPTVLTTHRPANVAFYARAGFEVVEERNIAPPGAAAYTVWSLARPAAWSLTRGRSPSEIEAPDGDSGAGGCAVGVCSSLSPTRPRLCHSSGMPPRAGSCLV